MTDEQKLLKLEALEREMVAMQKQYAAMMLERDELMDELNQTGPDDPADRAANTP